MRILKNANLTIVGVVVLFVISLLFAGSIEAEIDPETIAGMWLFDEGKGDTVADSSENGNAGTLVNAPEWVAGNFGGALSFDTMNAVSLPQVNYFAEGQQTLSMWVKPNKNPVPARGFLLAHPVTDNRVYIIQLANGNIIFQGGDLTSYTIFAANQYAAGQWLHIVLTRDYENQKLGAWVNGVETIASRDAVWNVPTVTPVWIGAFRNATEGFDGVIDEVAIFNTIISEADIKNIYANGLGQAINPTAAEPMDKLATTWADVKIQIAE